MAYQKKQKGDFERIVDQAFFEARDLPRRRDPGALKPYHVRLYEGDYEALKEHFEDQGITVSGGIRQVLRAYMKKEGIG